MWNSGVTGFAISLPEGGEVMANVTTEIVRKLLKEGQPVSETAKQFHISRQAAYHHVNKLRKKKPASDFPKPRKDCSRP